MGFIFTVQNHPTDQHQAYWPNLLRALATVAVIVVHVTSPVLATKSVNTDGTWWLANLLDSTCRFCVPIFLMLSGALLIPKKEKPLLFYKKRTQRIVWPFLFWALAYLCNQYFFRLTNPPVASKLPHWIADQLLQGISYHLWYIYLIFCIYLILPLATQWLQKATTEQLKYGLLCWVVITQLALPNFTHHKSPIHIVNFILLSGYPVLGYFYAHRVKIKYPKLALILIVAGVLGVALPTYLFTKSTLAFYPLFYNYLSLPVIIGSVGVFVTAMCFAKPKNWAEPMVAFISKHSFGIYLSHVLVLYWLGRWGLTWKFVSPIVGIMATIGCTLLLSAVLVWIVKKIPLGKWIAG